MAKNSIRDYDATAANNADIQSTDISEGCSPAGINNAIREVMADLKDVSTGTVALESPQADSLTVTGDLTVDTDTLYVDSTNNRVGIGVASPTQKLSVKDGSSAFIFEDASGSARLGLDGVNGDFTGGDYYLIDADGSSNLKILKGSDERMRIDSSGNVGIGTTSPATDLHVQGDGLTIRLDGTGNTSRGIFMRNTGTGEGQIKTDGNMHFIQEDASRYMRFSTGNTERMRIDSSGYVHIGGGNSANANLNIVTGSANGGIQVNRLSSGNLASGDVIGSYAFKGTDSNNSNAAAEAKIEAVAAQAHSGSAAGTDMRFYTKSNGVGPGSAPTERMRINSSGNVLIGTTTTSITTEGTNIGQDFLQVSRDSNAALLVNRSDNGACTYFYRNGTAVGNIAVGTSTTSYNTSSDHRLKENVETMTGAITRVKSLKPKRFSWIVDDEDAANIDGFLAHEAQSVVPEAVTGTHNETRAVANAVLSADGDLLDEDIPQADWTANKGDEDDDLYPSDSTWAASHTENIYQGIDQSKLVPLLTGALQEAITKIETLETEMTALKARVTTLENA